MKITKSQLKELIRHAIVEDIMDKEIENPKTGNKIKVRTALQLPDEHPANKKAKDMVAKSGVEKDDVGGPAYPNVKKGVKTSKQAKGDDKEKEPVKKTKIDTNPFDDKEKETGDRLKQMDAPDDYEDSMDDLMKQMGDDEEISGMGAAEKANKKMEIDVLNKKAEKGQGDLIDTEQFGMVSWVNGDPDEDSFIATNEDGEEIEIDYDEIIRFHNDNDSVMKNLNLESIKESKKKRYTVKEVRMWMKKLEENRYKRVYNSDARRVAWMVNNEGVELSEMPKSMSKKWTKAQYGRERYLATEFLKSKSEQLSETKFYAFFNKKKHTIDGKSLYDAKQKAITKLKVPKSKVGLLAIVNAKEHDRGGFRFEQKLRQTIREIIKEQMNEKINLGGAYEKMLKQQNDRTVKNASALIRAKIEKDYKVGKVRKGTKVTQRLIHTLIINGMKELRNKSKSPGLKKAFQDEINTQEKTLKQFRKDAMDEAYRSQSIFFDKKDKSKLEKLLKKNKGKFPFNPPGESVVNWSITNQGSKGLEWRGIPKSKYDKAVEFFMKNKLNPRG